MKQDNSTFLMRVEDFDLSLIPISADVLKADPDLLNNAISDYFAGIFSRSGTSATVTIHEGNIKVAWQTQAGPARDTLFDQALGLLKQGNQREAAPILQYLHTRFPDDTDVLYNFGMVLSDQGKFGTACQILEHLVELSPEHANGWTALGVALARNGQKPKAADAFKAALKADPNNAYALRNAASLIAASDPAEALSLFQKAVAILPQDQQALLGIGQCLLTLNRGDEAHVALKKCIAVNSLTEVAEHARKALTQLAHGNMRAKAGGELRMDVVMYCLGAMQRFHQVGLATTKTISFEIAMLGRNGFDINDPAQKYTLKSLPGQFSGMRLVCMMYVGFKMLDPKLDTGIDLSREYQEAKKMFDLDPSGSQS